LNRPDRPVFKVFYGRRAKSKSNIQSSSSRGVGRHEGGNQEENDNNGHHGAEWLDWKTVHCRRSAKKENTSFGP
jgi:hypothetical protein